MKKIRVSKPKVAMRLLWESRDKNYDEEDRKRYKKLFYLVNRMPYGIYKKVIKNNYDFYKGYCYANNKKVYIKETEFEILLTVIENIKENYYKKEGEK